MAVYERFYGEDGPRYEGCVLNTWEHNTYEDSDWYALVWDREEGRTKTINYDTTRAGTSGWAEIDATPDVLREAYRYYKADCRKKFDEYWNPTNAKKIRKGDTVRIVKGYKVKKGTEATVFWAGTRYNPYSRMEEERLGIEVDGERVFISARNAEVIGWEDRLLTGKARKLAIRKAAIRCMPYHYREMFREDVKKPNREQRRKAG